VQWRVDAAELLRSRRELVRVERRESGFAIADAVQAPYLASLFEPIARTSQSVEAQAACADARRSGAPAFSRSYYTPLPDGSGLEVMDLCVTLPASDGGALVATFSLPAVLEATLVADPSREHEMSFVEGDGARLARAGAARGAGIYRAERVVDLPGAKLQLRADSRLGRPHLIPNLSVALVFGLSIALTALVVLLARDLVLAVVLVLLKRRGITGLPVHFLGKAATFNLLYAFPLLLLGESDGLLPTLARVFGWAFAIWGTALYWWAALIYLWQVRSLAAAARSEGAVA